MEAYSFLLIAGKNILILLNLITRGLLIHFISCEGFWMPAKLVLTLGKELQISTAVIMPQIQIVETPLQPKLYPTLTVTPLGKERPTATAVVMPQMQIIIETPLPPKHTLSPLTLYLGKERPTAVIMALILIIIIETPLPPSHTTTLQAYLSHLDPERRGARGVTLFLRGQTNL